jgi:hypothetical protein
MVLLIFANDFVTMSPATDNSKSTMSPRWPLLPFWAPAANRSTSHGVAGRLCLAFSMLFTLAIDFPKYWTFGELGLELVKILLV